MWTVDSPPVDTPDAIEPVVFDENHPLDTAKPVRPEVVQSPAPSELLDDWKIVAIEFLEQDVAYVHSQWDAGAYDTPKTGDGMAFTELPLDADALLYVRVDDSNVAGAGAGADGSSTILTGGVARIGSSQMTGRPLSRARSVCPRTETLTRGRQTRRRALN